MITRRKLLIGLSAGIVAPAVVSAANIMPVRNRIECWRIVFTMEDYRRGADYFVDPDGWLPIDEEYGWTKEQWDRL